MINLNEFLEDFPFELTEDETSYYCQVTTEEDFKKIFLYIDEFSELECDQSMATLDNTIFVYTDGYYEITLSADLLSNIYNCVIKER